MIKTEALIIGGVLVGLYWFRERIGASLNPLSPQNVANQAAVSTYQAITGSTGTPGGDVAEVVYKNADLSSLGVLRDYFTKQGYNRTTLAKARELGWTDADIYRASFGISFTDTDW
jgi:hypothetical protein